MEYYNDIWNIYNSPDGIQTGEQITAVEFLKILFKTKGGPIEKTDARQIWHLTEPRTKKEYYIIKIKVN